MDEILPLAITMMAGPQIIASIILLTGRQPIRHSLAYMLGIGTAAIIGTLLFAGLARHTNLQARLPGSNLPIGRIIQTVLILLLVAATIKTYRNRKTAKLPPWVGNLQTATSTEAFKYGLKLVFFMPSDLVIMLTVGLSLASGGSPYIGLGLFIATTMLIAALPVIAFTIFRRRALALMPKVTDWMQNQSWVISIAAYIIFIILLW